MKVMIDEEMEEETFFERWSQGSTSEKADLLGELVHTLNKSPLDGWCLMHKLENLLKTGDLDAACCTRIAHSILPTLELFRKENSVSPADGELNEILQGMLFFVTEFMASVCLNEGPDIAFHCLDHLYKRSPQNSGFGELISALQNTIVDYFVAVPDLKPPSQSEKIVKFWFDGIVYALETSRFDISSKQVITLCRSIGDTFFGGSKLTSAVKKLNDFTGKIDESRSDFHYQFDVEVAKLVKRFSTERGALMGYSLLWAVLEAFLLRMKNEQDYLSVLMLLVHLMQASGAPIKCMATPSLLEYPQSDLDENERLFHLMKLLEIYIASDLYHPSVLVSGKKRFRGNLIFNDILVYILKHQAKGTSDWYKALLHLATISASIVVPKLRMILQVAWFDCDSKDVGAQDEFLLFLIDLYDRMHKTADLYTRFLGAINDYLSKPKEEPRLSEQLLGRMRLSFANLGSDDVIRIWTDYVKYLLQVLTKWSESGADLNKMPHSFTLKIFSEFVQHCPLVPQVQLTHEQHQKMDSAIGDTLTLTAKLEQVMEALPKNAKELLPLYLKVSQKFIKSRFVRSYYFDDAFDEGFSEAAQRQQVLVERVDENLKPLKKDKMLRLDILCNSIKLADDPKKRSNQCLSEICENFDTIDWQLLVCHHPQVLTSASKNHLDVFVCLLYEYLQEHDECLYVKSQSFRDSTRQVLSFVKLVARDLVAALVDFEADFGEIFDVDNLETPVDWSQLKKALKRVATKRKESIEIILKADKMLGCVPVQCLPPFVRLKFLAILIAYTLIEKEPTDEFFVTCFRFLEDWSSALKFKHQQDDEVSIEVCQLATLCLNRVLSVDPLLSLQRTSVKKTIDFLRYVLFVTAKKTESVTPFRAIVDKLSLKNDANFCAGLFLVETVTRLHSKTISSDEVTQIQSECQSLISAALEKNAFKLENMLFVSNKYAEVFGIERALNVQCIAVALKSAEESVLCLKPDLSAFQLCVKASKVEDVIPLPSLVYCSLLVGNEYLDELSKAFDAQLAQKVWPIVEKVFDDLRELTSFAESLAAEVDGSFQRHPFVLRTEDKVVTSSIIFERCLELTLSLVKHMSEEALTGIVTRIYRFVALRSFLPNLRLDICCLILDATSRKQSSPELFFPIYSALGSVPLDAVIKAPVDHWCIVMSITTDMYCRAFLLKPNYTNGVAQILLGAAGRLVEAAVTRCDCQHVSNNISEVAKIINVINGINRVLFVLHRMKPRDRTRTLEACGPLLLASYLHSVVSVSVHEKFRTELKSMAFLMLGLCTSKGLFALKLESNRAVQEALRRLIEEYKVKCNVRKL